jgi:hypothetical protein
MTSYSLSQTGERGGVRGSIVGVTLGGPCPFEHLVIHFPIEGRVDGVSGTRGAMRIHSGLLFTFNPPHSGVKFILTVSNENATR